MVDVNRFILINAMLFVSWACDPFHREPQIVQEECEKGPRLFWKSRGDNNQYWDGKCEMKDITVYYSSDDLDVQYTVNALKELTG